MNHDHARYAREAARPGSSDPNAAAHAYAILALADAMNNIATALITRPAPTTPPTKTTTETTITVCGDPYPNGTTRSEPTPYICVRPPGHRTDPTSSHMDRTGDLW